MRFHYLLILLSGSLLVACGDKTANNQATPEPAATTATTATATTAPAAPSTATPMISDLPAIAGSGCAAGNAKIEVQSNKDSFTLNLAELEAGTEGQKTNITCTLAIPVSVPAGYQVSILPMHFKGSLAGNGLKVELRREYFFAGTTGTPEVSSLSSPADSSFDISDTVNNDDVTQWSICGEDTNIRANVRLIVKAGQGLAKLVISSGDTAQPNLFKLNYRPCN